MGVTGFHGMGSSSPATRPFYACDRRVLKNFPGPAVNANVYML
jgi:hypothetical protein